MLDTPLKTLEAYVNQPSGTNDPEDVRKFAEMVAEDFRSLGFSVQLIPGCQYGPKLRAMIGSGDRQLMLMGHMDTVFSHDSYVPFRDIGGGKAMGSGIIDMKGGDVVMLYALKEVLPKLDLRNFRICAFLNPDEEIGSIESRELILETAKQSFAALSFEPCGENGRLTCARKGVTSFRVSCRGIPGHSGAKYLECASAIQALCALITDLYRLRDDAREISFNAGVIRGGTAENVVAAEAECACEFRYFDEKLKEPLMGQIREICAREPVPGVTTSIEFGPSHPAIDLNEKSSVLLDLALSIAKKQGWMRYHQKTGGAGDISIAGQTGIGVLDGLGLIGTGMHTMDETANLESLPQQIALASEMIRILAAGEIPV
ncbi:MAG: M20/M25/M40 family metallo-hydrolase [Clostridia bacterium]|nr:M20/M25/M40 family metallo-hydrolase [Clostridia bacterium]